MRRLAEESAARLGLEPQACGAERRGAEADRRASPRAAWGSAQRVLTDLEGRLSKGEE